MVNFLDDYEIKLWYVFLGLMFLPGLNCQTPQTDRNNQSGLPDRPNIIFILADDLGYGDLSCYGQQKFSTPNIDRLAREGIRFTQHYSGSTVCAPSRSALMTGLHTGHTFIRGNKEVQPEGQYPIPDSLNLLTEILQSKGYRTGAFGKWGLGFPGSEGDPLNQGIDEFFGYNCQRLGHHYYPYYLWENDRKFPLTENEGSQELVYGPELIHEKTLAFIENNQDQPFFLYVPSIIPHAELKAPQAIMEKHIGKYDPENAYQGTDDGDRYRNGPYGSQRHPHAAFVAMMEILDTQVGDILAKLEELEMDENTMIIFTSDNGPHLEGGADPDYFDSNGPLRGYKRDLYEGGIRVPLIIRWPNVVEAGSTSAHISASWDFLPTFLDILNIHPTEPLDGLSLYPELAGEPSRQAQHEYLYWEFHERGGRIAVRQGPWKAVRYNLNEAPPQAAELYNLEEDPGEQNNLADRQSAKLSELETIMQQARTPSAVFTFDLDTYLNLQ